MGKHDGARAGTNTSTPAVVLKLDPNVMHHGGLGVIRSLGRLGVPVYGVHEGPLAPAASSRYLRGRCFWQPGPDDAERIRAGLLTLADRIGRPAVLLPTDDAGAIFLAEHGADLRHALPLPRPAPRPAPAGGRQVLAVPAVPRAGHARPPRPRCRRRRHAAREFAAEAGFPLIAKLTTPWRRSERAAQHLDPGRARRARRRLRGLRPRPGAG